MKTKKISMTSIYLVMVCFSFSVAVAARPGGKPGNWLETGLKSIPKATSGSISYKMTADYFNRDIEGNFLNKSRASGYCTINQGSREVTWKNCSVSNSNSKDAEFPEGEKLAYMEGYSYIPGYQMSEASAFPGWPENSFHGKNLVWDMLAFEAFGLVYLDSLPLNKRIIAKAINAEVNLAGQGSFENRNSTVRWMGITELNNVPCALIEYRQIDGKVVVEAVNMKMKGRSNYWGTIWVSLSSRQIEYAEMTEEVNMNIMFPGQQQGQWFSTLREIVVEKAGR